MTHDQTAIRKHAMPFTRVEVAVMALIDGGLQVLLARRAEAPHAGAWALPGGVLRIDLDGNLDDAAFCERLVKETRVAAIPVSAFYAEDAVRNVVRFCFAKTDATLDAALARLKTLV